MYHVTRQREDLIALQNAEHPEAPKLILRSTVAGYAPAFAEHADGRQTDLPPCFALRQEGIDALYDFLRSEQ